MLQQHSEGATDRLTAVACGSRCHLVVAQKERVKNRPAGTARNTHPNLHSLIIPLSKRNKIGTTESTFTLDSLGIHLHTLGKVHSIQQVISRNPLR